VGTRRPENSTGEEIAKTYIHTNQQCDARDIQLCQEQPKQEQQ
jgi:hypothetical protein